MALALLFAGEWAATPMAAESGGTLRLEVRLQEPAPPWPVIRTDKNRDFCGETLSDPVLVTRNGLVANAVVSVRWNGEDTPPDAEPLTLTGSHCLLEPRIQTGQTGSLLTLAGADEITHNPHGWWNDERSVFNITLIDPGRTFRRRLRWPGRYRVDCDTHSWMRAYIVLFDHPYHAVTGEDGVAEITGLPADRHQVHVWHEVLGEAVQEVGVQSGETVTSTVILPLVDHRPEILKPPTALTPWP